MISYQILLLSINKKSSITAGILISLIITLSGCSGRNQATQQIDSAIEDVSLIESAKIGKSGLELVSIEGGNFTMGGNDDVDDGVAYELRIADECPHLVTIENFQIAKYEVTQADWFEIMGTNPSYHPGCNYCPVNMVSWNDVQIFIQKLNLKTGESYRLPTEEEWEFAARGVNMSKGFIYSGSNNADEIAWYQENANNKPHPVGTKLPNELGIYDMSGNIWEWCSNVKLPYPCDSIGKKFDSAVLRGATFSHRETNLRTIDRNARDKDMRLQTLGFRLAK